MIYTVTLNPSIDYIVGVEGFKEGLINRTTSELVLPGGKGINVSIVLRNLGVDSVALGFMAGYTGRTIKELLTGFDVTSDFVDVSKGISRINVKLKNLSKTDSNSTVSSESEINGKGPVVSEGELEAFYAKLEKLVVGDILVLSGSIPASLPGSMYYDILSRIKDRDIITIVDAGKELLLKVLELRPYLVKPNHIELGDIFGVNIDGQDMAIEYARKLQAMGARNVLVSMAGDGAVLITEDGRVYKKAAPSGQVVNSVGAGDSMVAGYIFGMIQTADWLGAPDYELAMRYGLAAGSASAFSDGLATYSKLQYYLEQI